MRHMIISATPLLTAACLHCFALTTTAHLHRNCLSVLFVFVAVIVVVVVVVVLVLAKLCEIIISICPQCGSISICMQQAVLGIFWWWSFSLWITCQQSTCEPLWARLLLMWAQCVLSVCACTVGRLALLLCSLFHRYSLKTCHLCRLAPFRSFRHRFGDTFRQQLCSPYSLIVADWSWPHANVAHTANTLWLCVSTTTPFAEKQQLLFSVWCSFAVVLAPNVKTVIVRATG